MSSPSPSHSAARVLMSTLFLVSGTGKLGSVKPTQEYMEAYGVPGYLLYPAAALEIGGGMMLLMGMHTKWLSRVLAGWCILTAMIFHTDLQDQTQKIMMMKNMAMAGGFLILADTNPGKGAGLEYIVGKWQQWRRHARRIQLSGETGEWMRSADLLEKSGLMEEMPQAFKPEAIPDQYVVRLFQCQSTALLICKVPSQATRKLSQPFCKAIETLSSLPTPTPL